MNCCIRAGQRSERMSWNRGTLDSGSSNREAKQTARQLPSFPVARFENTVWGTGRTLLARWEDELSGIAEDAGKWLTFGEEDLLNILDNNFGHVMNRDVKAAHGQLIEVSPHHNRASECDFEFETLLFESDPVIWSWGAGCLKRIKGLSIGISFESLDRFLEVHNTTHF